MSLHAILSSNPRLDDLVAAAVLHGKEHIKTEKFSVSRYDWDTTHTAIVAEIFKRVSVEEEALV